MKCVICEVRKPRRYCPGVRGDICAICCGTERENTIDCPLDCVYLHEARLFEKPVELDEDAEKKMPFSDIRIPQHFAEEHSIAMFAVANAVVMGIVEAPSAIDYDVREALEALIQTYKTLQSGLIYESRLPNPIAANIYSVIQDRIAEIRKRSSSEGANIRDSEVLISLVVFQRREYIFNNGRRRGRAFIDNVKSMFPDVVPVNPTTSSLIV